MFHRLAKTDCRLQSTTQFMRSIIIFLLSLFTLLPSTINSQEVWNSKMNTIQIELGGHGVSYTLSYERFLISKDHFKLSTQAGFSYNPEFIGIIEYWFPIMINQLYSIGNHYIESGIGIIPYYSSVRGLDNEIVNWEWGGLFGARIGFRFQYATRPLFLRIA